MVDEIPKEESAIEINLEEGRWELGRSVVEVRECKDKLKSLSPLLDNAAIVSCFRCVFDAIEECLDNLGSLQHLLDCERSLVYREVERQKNDCSDILR